MIVVKAILVVAFIAVGTVLAVSNAGTTQSNYLADETGIPTAWLAVASRATGALLGVAFSAAAVLRGRHHARRAEAAGQELGRLRSRPCQGA